MGGARIPAHRSSPAAVRRLSALDTGASRTRSSRGATALLTGLALLAFAANSLLCRVALTRTTIDPATFTTLRIISGAAVLYLLARTRTQAHSGEGSWLSALALFTYAAAFSFAYVALTAGTGALLLFGAVQATMITVGVMRGERLHAAGIAGLLLAYTGLIALVLPGLAAPPLTSALLMLAAGVAWGVYSVRARRAGDPTRVTAGNFARAIPMALLVSAFAWPAHSLDITGAVCAIASGAIASGVGYAIWYTALRSLAATTAATVQLSVPVLAAVGGVLLLSEPLTTRLFASGAAILGGVALVLVTGARRQAVE